MYIYIGTKATPIAVVPLRPFNGMMRQTVWAVCGFTDRQRRPWSQSDWLGVRTRRAQGPPEVAHHRPTFSTSGLALSPGPRTLFLSLRGFPTFHFPQVSLTGHEDVEITRWRNNRMAILFADKSDYFHEFKPGITGFQEKIVTRVYYAYMLLLSIVFSGGEGERFVSIKRKLRVLIFFVNPSFCIVQR